MAADYIINFTDNLKGNFVIRPYTSNGPKFPTTSVLNNTSIAASSSLLLYGKGHPEYGERTNENLLHLLENFSGATEPVVKTAGMLWHKEVLYYKDTGGSFYVAGSGSPIWNPIALAGTGALPLTATDGDYWWDNTGSPTTLYQFSADERNINGWIVREFDEASGAPTAPPTKEMQIYDGTAWDVLPDLTTVNALVSGAGALLLDTSNGPLTGDLDILKVSPVLSLTGSDPVVDLVGSDPTIRLRGGTNWQAAGNDASDVLEFRVGAVLGTDTHFVIDNANDYLTHGNATAAATYATNVNGVPNALPNVQYVDNLVAGAVVGDTFINGGTFSITGSPGTGTLSMPYSTGSPGGALVITGFDSVNIPFTTGFVGLTEPATTVDDALGKCAPTNSPFFTGNVTVPAISASDGSNEAANKGYVDTQLSSLAASVSATNSQRSVQTGGVTTFTLPFNYVAGSNQLMVFKNGIKQYKDELASSTAIFAPTITLDQQITGLGPVGNYVINGVNPGTDTWTIAGNHAPDFGAGDTFDVGSNGFGGANITYTVVSAVNVGANTDIVVSPATIPGGALANGFVGINYNFSMILDGVGPSAVVNINSLNIAIVADLITEMQAAVDTTFGPGLAAVYLHGGNIRVDSLSLPGSPAPGVTLLNGATSTTDLFDILNLGADGFSIFSGTAATSYAYFESDAGGPPGVAPSNAPANTIEFNVATLGSDVIEFLLV